MGTFLLERVASADEISIADTMMDPSGSALAALLAEMDEEAQNSDNASASPTAEAGN